MRKAAVDALEVGIDALAFDGCCLFVRGPFHLEMGDYVEARGRDECTLFDRANRMQDGVLSSRQRQCRLTDQLRVDIPSKCQESGLLANWFGVDILPNRPANDLLSFQVGDDVHASQLAQGGLLN